MRITKSRLSKIIQEEYKRALILEQKEAVAVQDDVSQAAKSAELAASDYGLSGMDWNSIITTLVASGVTAGLDATGVGIPIAQVINAGALVKAGYEAIQSSRSIIQIEKLVKELTGEYPNVALMGLTFDRPLTREAIDIIKNLPQDQKDRLGLLIASYWQYMKKSLVSLINAAPDEIISGGLAGVISLMPAEEFIISSSELAAEAIEIIPWLDDFLRMDNIVSKALHTILNRMLMLNMGRIAGAIEMLDPTRLDRLPDAPEMEFTPYVPPEVEVDDEEEEEEYSQQVPIPFPSTSGQPAALSESFSYSRMGLLAGIKR